VGAHCLPEPVYGGDGRLRATVACQRCTRITSPTRERAQTRPSRTSSRPPSRRSRAIVITRAFTLSMTTRMVTLRPRTQGRAFHSSNLDLWRAFTMTPSSNGEVERPHRSAAGAACPQGDRRAKPTMPHGLAQRLLGVADKLALAQVQKERQAGTNADQACRCNGEPQEANPTRRAFTADKRQ
jgi:hypothetical protein